MAAVVPELALLAISICSNSRNACRVAFNACGLPNRRCELEIRNDGVGSDATAAYVGYHWRQCMLHDLLKISITNASCCKGNTSCEHGLDNECRHYFYGRMGDNSFFWRVCNTMAQGGDHTGIDGLALPCIM